MFSRFVAIPACDGQTDRQTDRHLANLANYSYLVQCVALLGKNAQMLTRNNKSIGLVRVTRSTAVVERPRDAFAKSVNVTQRHSKWHRWNGYGSFKVTGSGTVRKLGTVSYSHSIATISVSLAVSEIYSIKYWRDLEIPFTGHSTSLEIAPFDWPHASFYWRSVVTMALSCIISETKRDIGRKSRFFNSPCIQNPCYTGLVAIMP